MSTENLQYILTIGVLYTFLSNFLLSNLSLQAGGLSFPNENQNCFWEFNRSIFQFLSSQ